MAISPDAYPLTQNPPDGGFPVSGEPVQEAQQPEQPAYLKLRAFFDMENVAEAIDDAELGRIGQRCVSEYKIDKDTRDRWEEENKEAIKLAKQVKEDKSFPWANAANVKFPLLAEAAITFAARAYPEIVQGNNIVKAKVTGSDPDGAKADKALRVSRHMSWQLSDQMEEWEEDTDKLLTQLPLVGSVFRKTYYDPVRGRNVSCIVPAVNLIVNNNIQSLEVARRETEVLELYGNDVLERQRSGRWLKKSCSTDPKDGIPDEDKPYTFLEQHRWLDLDGDGYEEPYIVTVHEASSQVVRIVCRFELENVVINGDNEIVRIEPERSYTHYPFMPDPDGGLLGIGFGRLLSPINESINTVLNQLLDSGTLANLQGGFLAKGIRIKGGGHRFSPGEWKTTDSVGGALKDGILPLPYKEPSVVLLNLLGLLIDAGKSLASIKDVLSGELPGANVPATTVLALIEQGQKVYSAIHKRIFRALRLEFRKLFRLNGKHLPEEEYFTVLDHPEAISRQDYAARDLDIDPVADPQVSSQAQRLARAQALMPLMETPGAKATEIQKEYVTALGFDNPERFVPTEEEAQAAQAQQMQLAADQMGLAKAKATAEIAKSLAQTKEIHAKAIKTLAEAESLETGNQIELYKGQLATLVSDIGFLEQRQQEALDAIAQPAGMGGVAGPPGNGVVPQQFDQGTGGAPRFAGDGGNAPPAF